MPISPMFGSQYPRETDTERVLWIKANEARLIRLGQSGTNGIYGPANPTQADTLRICLVKTLENILAYGA